MPDMNKSQIINLKKQTISNNQILNTSINNKVQSLGIENYFGVGAWNLGFSRA